MEEQNECCIKAVKDQKGLLDRFLDLASKFEEFNRLTPI